MTNSYRLEIEYDQDNDKLYICQENGSGATYSCTEPMRQIPEIVAQYINQYY